MNSNVAQLLLMVAAGIGGPAMLRATRRRQSGRRAYRTGTRLMHAQG